MKKAKAAFVSVTVVLECPAVRRSIGISSNLLVRFDPWEPTNPQVFAVDCDGYGNETEIHFRSKAEYEKEIDANAKNLDCTREEALGETHRYIRPYKPWMDKYVEKARKLVNI